MMFSGLISRCTMPASCAAAIHTNYCFLGFNTPTPDPRCVPRRQGSRHLLRHIQRFPDFHPGAGQVLAERFAFDVFRSDEVVTLVLADLMDGEDIRMIQAGGGLRLTLETAEARVVASEFPWEQLDRDKTTETGVLRQVHFPHTAGAEQGTDRVTSKTSPERKCHGAVPVATMLNSGNVMYWKAFLGATAHPGSRS